MEDKDFYMLLIELLEDDDLRYHINFTNNVCICLILGRHLTKIEIDYIYSQWRGFYNEPSNYCNLKYIIIECLDNLESIRKESE